MFKLAYASFSIDSLSEASYYFSKLMTIESKYASTSRYYYAYIAYKKGIYKTALNHFQQLIGDDKFGAIIPYYITQIYFSQKNYKQLIDFASILAVVVFPVPRGPVKRYACPILFWIIACFRVLMRVSCPITSLKNCGRHFL